jgi:hypothetical protein
MAFEENTKPLTTAAKPSARSNRHTRPKSWTFRRDYSIWLATGTPQR